MTREEMTNEKAIAIMLSYDGYFIGYSSDEVNEAIDTVVDMTNNWDWLKIRTNQADRNTQYGA